MVPDWLSTRYRSWLAIGQLPHDRATIAGQVHKPPDLRLRQHSPITSVQAETSFPLSGSLSSIPPTPLPSPSLTYSSLSLSLTHASGPLFIHYPFDPSPVNFVRNKKICIYIMITSLSYAWEDIDLRNFDYLGPSLGSLPFPSGDTTTPFGSLPGGGPAGSRLYCGGLLKILFDSFTKYDPSPCVIHLVFIQNTLKRQRV